MPQNTHLYLFSKSDPEYYLQATARGKKKYIYIYISGAPQPSLQRLISLPKTVYDKILQNQAYGLHFPKYIGLQFCPQLMYFLISTGFYVESYWLLGS